MRFKLLIFLPLLFFFACDSHGDNSEPRNEPPRKSIVDSLAALPKEIVNVSPPLERDADYKKAVKRDAADMNALLVKKRFKDFVKYASPVLIDKLGGEEAMVLALKNGFKEMEAGGNKLNKIILDEPDKILAVGNELQTTITETLEMKVPGGLLITRSVLIAISKDGGLSWTFIDSSGKDLKTLRSELVGLSEELVVAAPVKPKFLELTKKSNEK